MVALTIEGIYTSSVDGTCLRQWLRHSSRAICALNRHLLQRVACVSHGSGFLFHNILLVDLLWVLLAQQEGSLVNAALCPNGSLNRSSKNWELNPVLYKIRTFRYFKELGVPESFSKLTNKSSFDLILSLSSLVVGIFSHRVRLGLDLPRGVAIAIHK